MKRLAVFVSGSGTNLQAIVDACESGVLPDTRVVVVVSNRKAAYALERAKRHGVPTLYHPLLPYRERYGREDDRAAREPYDRDLAAKLAPFQPDLIVLAGWMHLFTWAFLEPYRGRILNIHPALPGLFPGTHAIADAYAAYGRGEIDHTGVMVFRVADESVDAGPVVVQRQVLIQPDDTLETLEARIHAVEHRLYLEAIARELGIKLAG